MEPGGDKKNILPFSIQDRFFDFLEGKISGAEFEKWLYANQELEQIDKNVYLELIILDFRNSKAATEVLEIIGSYLNYSHREKAKIITLLKSLILLDDAFPKTLNKIYDLTWLKYYDFFSELQKNTYPLAFDVGIYYRDDWGRLSIIEREQITHPFHKVIKDQAVDIIDRINNNTIILNCTWLVNFPVCSRSKSQINEVIDLNNYN
jgi:hypothetical protein